LDCVLENGEDNLDLHFLIKLLFQLQLPALRPPAFPSFSFFFGGVALLKPLNFTQMQVLKYSPEYPLGLVEIDYEGNEKGSYESKKQRINHPFDIMGKIDKISNIRVDIRNL